MAEMKKKLPINGGYPLHTFEQVEEVYLSYISSPDDRRRIREAYEFILKKHDGQMRKSGEPYYHHLIEVAYIIASLHAGPNTIIATLPDNRMITCCDSKKLRPVVLGQDENMIAISSEVCGLNEIMPDRDKEKDIYPNEREVIVIDNELEVQRWKQ